MAVGRVGARRRELVLAGTGSVAAAVTLTWPSVAHPASTIPGDLGDPLMQAWEAAWGGHALLNSPSQLFDGNVFWPLRDTLAFSDSLLGYLPAGLVGHGPTAALVRYNLLYVFAAALAALGGYLLGRQLGARPLAAAVTGAAFAYAPWRLAQAGHLNVLSTGGIPLALALLARGHGLGRAGPPRPGAAVAGWLVAAWQISLGFAVGLPFAYLLALATVLFGGRVALRSWRAGRWPRPPRRLLAADLVGIAVFLGVGLAMALPYLAVVHTHPEARRNDAWVRLYSPPPSGLVTAPAEDRVWGPLQTAARAHLGWPPEMALFPGLTVTVLATAGLFVAPWSWRRRVTLAVAAAVAAVFALGTTVAGGHWTYLLLLHDAPGWAGLRTPGRLILYVSLAFGLLAAGALERVARWLPPRVAAVVLTAAVAAAVVEGLPAVPHPTPPRPPVALGKLAAPVLVLPSDDIHDDTVMFWSTDGFPLVVNGSSGFDPVSLVALRAAVADFPDRDSVTLLRSLGVRTVLLLPAQAVGTPWAGAAGRPVAGLGVTTSVSGGAVVYRLR